MTAFQGHIHFFDIESKLQGNQQSWSPNTLKIRMTLNYKRIPYVESFLSYPDIAPFGRHFGLRLDPGYEPPRPTLPAILHYDEEGTLVKAMSNSIDIARYLDEVSPDRPVLNPAPGCMTLGWLGAAEAMLQGIRTGYRDCVEAGYEIVVPTIPPILDDRAREWFIADRTKDDEEGRSPLDWGSADPEDDWKMFLRALERFSRMLSHTTEAAPFFLGTEPSYADFFLASNLTWFRRGSEENFRRILAVTKGDGAFERHYNACEGWVLGQGEVKEWDNERQRVASNQ